ncbi:MAG: LexA family transcriptional regulator [Proteobacteria bacterium]|nr:LexA family transcriptional regulator [Pseudomonadota bacterium]
MQAKLSSSLHGGSNHIGKRLKQEMKKRGVTSARLASDAGVKTSFIYDIISGKSSNPSTVKLARVAESLGVSLASLVDGSQQPGTVPPASAKAPDMAHIAQLTVDFSQNIPVPTPVYSNDEPLTFNTSWIRHQLAAQPDQLRWLHISGDGMEPTLCNRDMVLIDITQQTATPPGIFVLYDGFGLVAKRLEHPVHQPGRVRIISDNPQYSSYEKSLDDIRILGRVVWFARIL